MPKSLKWDIIVNNGQKENIDMDERKKPVIDSDEEEQKKLTNLFPIKKIRGIEEYFNALNQPLKFYREAKYDIIQSSAGELYIIHPHALGEGTSGVVKKAWRIIDHSNLLEKKLLEQEQSLEFIPLAIKLFKNEMSFSEKEMKAITVLSDPEATKTEIGKSKQIIMRYIPGDSLMDDQGNLHESIKSLPLSSRLNIITAILTKLKQIHQLGWVHCDIKGQNIKFVIDPVTQKINIYIVDFGSARKLEKLTIDKSAMGTPKYLSPERELGLIKPSTDIFALAQDIPLILGSIDLPKEIPVETKEKILKIKDNFIAQMKAHFPQDRPAAEEALKFFKDFQILCQGKYPAFFLSSDNKENFLNEFLKTYEKILKLPQQNDKRRPRP